MKKKKQIPLYIFVGNVMKKILLDSDKEVYSLGRIFGFSNLKYDLKNNFFYMRF